MLKSYSLLTLLLSAALSAVAQNPTPQSRVLHKTLAGNGSPRLIEFVPGAARYSAAETSKALQEQLQLSQDEHMTLVKKETDDLGYRHEKYQQYYRGIKVEHGVYSVHIQAGGIESLSGDIKRISQLNTSPTLSAKEALGRALAFVGATRYMWQLPQEEAGLKLRDHNPDATYLPTGELVILSTSPAKATLAWKFDIFAQAPLSRSYVYIDAATGAMLLQDAIIKSITGTFDTKYSGTRNVETQANPAGGYRLREATRGTGNGIETYNAQRSASLGGAVDFVDNDNTWSAAEYNNANYDNAAGDAHFGAEATYDYWKNVHGRNSWNNAGGVLRSYVHYDQGFDNAQWDGAEMLYGDGSVKFKPLTSLDITAHEIGHGVCQSTAGLVYRDESGAMNEGLSDIWGACVEQYAAATYGLTKSTWLLGEEVVKSGVALRSMSDPKSLGQPAYYHGTNWYTGTDDAGGVHTNSGVLNHWFYILSQGETGRNEGGNSYTVSGIGINSAARIAYRMESVYLTANSQYADARSFAIRAATDLFGACSPELTATTNAWYAVGIGAAAPVAVAPTMGQGTYTICGTKTVSVGVYAQQSAISYTWYAQNYSVQVNGSGTYYGVTTTASNAQVTLPAGAAATYQLYVTANTACGPGPRTTFYVQESCATTAPSNVSFVTSSSGTTCAPRYNVRVSRVSSATSYTATLHGGSFEGYSLTISNPDQYAYYFDFPFNIAGPVTGISASVTATTPGGTSAPDYSPVQNLAGGSGCRTAATLASTPADGQVTQGIYPNPATNQVVITGIDQEAQVDFYDVRGARCKTVLLHEPNAHTSVNLLDLAAGLYNVRVSANGKVLQTSKLVVTH